MSRRADPSIPDGDALQRFAIEVCQEYRAGGWAITLRQLYYQGVNRKVLPSSQKAYDALKTTLAKARMDGKFPLWAIVDRTRVVHPSAQTRNDCDVARALDRAADVVRELPDSLLHRDRWLGQPNHVSVLFEKEALAGIFEATCAPLGVGTFACHGDASHAGLYDWLQKAALAHGIDNPKGWRDDNGSFHKGMAKKSVVLYFGDHDPTGIRIPRTLEATLRRFMEITQTPFPLEFVRVGLTLEQARSMDLAPFWAKSSAGSDYDRYVEEFGTTDAWELDALAPPVLERLVKEAVGARFDDALYRRLQHEVDARREQMRVGMQSPEWHRKATAPLDV